MLESKTDHHPMIICFENYKNVEKRLIYLITHEITCMNLKDLIQSYDIIAF